MYIQTSTLQFITGDQGTRQYADEGDEIIAHQLNAEPQRSFDNLGSSASDSEDNAFLSEAPPQYYDIVTESLVPPGTVHQQITVSVNANTDVPAQIVSEPYQPPQQQVPTSNDLQFVIYLAEVMSNSNYVYIYMLILRDSICACTCRHSTLLQ